MESNTCTADRLWYTCRWTLGTRNVSTFCLVFHCSANCSSSSNRMMSGIEDSAGSQGGFSFKSRESRQQEEGTNNRWEKENRRKVAIFCPSDQFRRFCTRCIGPKVPVVRCKVIRVKDIMGNRRRMRKINDKFALKCATQPCF